MDAVDHGADVQQQEHAEHDEHHLGNEVGKGEHQVEKARLLDADDVDADENDDQYHGGGDVPIIGAERAERRYVLAHRGGVADREVSRDGDGGRVVEQLNPPDDESDRLVERTPREARAPTCMR